MSAQSGCDWWDCEGLERRHNVCRGTVIILDAMTAGNYTERRSLFDGRVPVLPLDERLTGFTDNLAMLPHFPFSKWKTVWQNLKMTNILLGCEFFEGMVAKDVDEPYPIQLRSPDENHSGWIKFRWRF